MRNTLNNLRARPKDEKTAIAAGTAIAIVAILFVAWLIYFFHDIQSNSVSLQSSGATVATDTDQTDQQSYGSTTQFTDVEGNVELQPISTSTDLSQ